MKRIFTIKLILLILSIILFQQETLGTSIVTYSGKKYSAPISTNNANIKNLDIAPINDTSNFSDGIQSVKFVNQQKEKEAQLKQLFVDGVAIKSFNADQINYYYLPHSYIGVPSLEGITLENEATCSVTLPSNLLGTEEERTATIIVTSLDGLNQKIYRVIFEIIPKMDLFLCIGQSNMAGRAPMDTSKGDFDPMGNVFLFTPDNSWEIASNPMNKYSAVRMELFRQGISPSYSFAKKIAVYSDEIPIGMVVNARGATAISSWLKNSTDTLYQSSLRISKEAQKWGDFKAIIWHQGEGDSGGNMTLYSERLKSIVSDFRRDLNINNLYFVAGELGYWRGGGYGSNAFNEMIRTISTFIENASYASAIGLTPVKGDINDPHFDRESQFILGERYADIVLKEVYGINTSISKNHKLNSEKDNIKILKHGKQLTIQVNGQYPYALYFFNGQQFITGSVKDSSKTMLLDSGLYVIKIGTNVYKIIIS